MSDPTQIGVRVWRIEHEGFPPIVQPESWTGSQENADSFARAVSKVGVSHTITEHLAIPLDAATLAELRERVAEMANEFGNLTADAAIGNGKHWPDTATFADAVLAALGLSQDAS